MISKVINSIFIGIKVLDIVYDNDNRGILSSTMPTTFMTSSKRVWVWQADLMGVVHIKR
jgi:hypothetical protein